MRASVTGEKMNRKRNLIIGSSLVVAIALLGVGQATLEGVALSQTVQAPIFEIDPYWPKPLPNGWVYGTVIGVTVDAQDHVYIVHRGVTGAEAGADQNPPLAECCSSAPPILEFDAEGNLIRAWGGPSETDEYVWPSSNHGLGVDQMGNIWIGGNGNGDSHVLKFTQEGEYLETYGEPLQGPNSLAMNHYGRVADIEFDFDANEAFFSDGYVNKRVAVVDMTSGDIKRTWGAYGNVPDDMYEYMGDRRAGTGWSADDYEEQQFRTPVHCAEPSNDGLLYVCDRPNNRVQVFNLDGTYVREAFYEPETLGDGSTWDIAFSPDAEQSFIYIADGKNARIRIVNRQTMEEVSTIGTGGRYAGMFQAVHSVDTDSQGNLYATETYEGRRLHKFIYKGIGDAARHQGATWPTGN
jgi:DNA-binding beta-propeller fold protein YncE